MHIESRMISIQGFNNSRVTHASILQWAPIENGVSLNSHVIVNLCGM